VQIPWSFYFAVVIVVLVEDCNRDGCFPLRLYSDVISISFMTYGFFHIKINCYKDPLSLNKFNRLGDTPVYSVFYLWNFRGCHNIKLYKYDTYEEMLDMAI
jgi:hypothetical protein